MGLFLVSFPSIRLQNLYFTISDFFLIASIILLVLKSRFGIRKLTSVYHKDLVLGFYLIFIGFTVSSISASYYEKYLVILLQYMFVIIVLPTAINNSSRNNYYIYSYILGLLVSVAIGLLDFNNIISVEGFISNKRRLESFFENPNAMAKIIALSLPIFIYLFSSNNKYKYKSFIIISMVIMVWGLISTASYGGIISCLLGVLIYGILSDNKLKTILVYMFITTIFLSTALYFKYPDTFIDRVVNNILYKSGEYGSMNYKIELFRIAIDWVLANPLVGIGPGGFSVNAGLSTTIHNSYLLLWVEGGILAIVGLVYIFYKLIKTILNQQNITQNELALAITVIIIFMINAGTNTHLYQRYLYIPLFISVNNAVFKNLRSNWKNQSLI